MVHFGPAPLLKGETVSSKPSLEQMSPKLDSIARCIERIESKQPFSVQKLESDFDLQDIISVNLERAIQQAVDVATMILSRGAYPTPGNMADCFPLLEKTGWIDSTVAERMVKAVGFRNVMVHEYEKMNWAIVHRIATEHLKDLKNFGAQVIQKAAEK